MKTRKKWLRKTTAICTAALLGTAAIPSTAFATDSYASIEKDAWAKKVTEMASSYATSIEESQSLMSGMQSDMILKFEDSGRSLLGFVAPFDVSWLDNVTLSNDISFTEGKEGILMRVLLNDNKICTLEYYLDPDSQDIYMRIPELSDKYFKTNLEEAADQQAAAPKKKGGVIWLQWRRWGSIAAVLVLAAGTAFLLQNSSLQNKASQDESSYDAALVPNEAENQDQWIGAATGGPPTDGLMMAPPPNPSTAGGDGSVKKEYATDEIDSDRGLFEEFKSKIVSVGEQPITDMMDYDAMAAVSSQLFGNDYEQAIAMFYDSGERWEGCELPTSCAHYFMLDKTLYGFFPEERRVVDYSGACATVLNEDEAAMLSAILEIEFTAKTE